MWALTEELSPKMTLEVASRLFELYLTLADIQRFWSSIPGRWVYSPTCPLPTYPFPQPVSIPSAPFLHLSLYPHLAPSATRFQASKRALEQEPKGPTQEAFLGALLPGDPEPCWLRVSELGVL